MSERASAKIDVSPLAVLVLTAFVALGSPLLLSALLLAALCHELGHYLAVRCLGGQISQIKISVFGAEMTVAGHFSYGGDILAFLAGPAVNLLAAAALACLGRQAEVWYLFAGAQAVLGLFNLLPILPLDGGRVLWSLVAWRTEPYTADRTAKAVGCGLSALLLLAAGGLLLHMGGTIFLLLAPLGLLVWYARGGCAS